MNEEALQTNESSHGSSRHRRRHRHQRPWLARFSQRLIFALSLVILILATGAGTGTAPWVVGAIESTVAVAVMLWVARLLTDRNARAVFPPMAVPLLLFALCVIVRSVLSDVEPVARQQALLVFAVILYYFLVINNVNQGAQATLMLWTAVALATVVAGAACWRSLSVETAAAASDSVDVPWLANAGQMAGYLQLVFPLAAAHVLFSRRSATERIVLLLVVLMIGAALVLSFDQSIWLGWLASVFVLGAYLVKRQTERRRWALLGATLGTVVVGGLVAIHFLSGERSGAIDSQPQRWALWQSAWSMGLHDWQLGSGPGMFPWQFPIYRTLQAAPDGVRNEYLHVFAEHGVLGILLLGWAAASFIHSAINILRERKARYSADVPSNRYAFAVGGLAMIVTVLVGSVLECMMHAPAILFTLAAMVAIVMTGKVHHRENDKVEHKTNRTAGFALTRATRYALAAGLAVIAVMFTLRLTQNYPAWLYLRQAERERAQLHWRAAESLYNRAWELDSSNFVVAEALGDLYSARATWNTQRRAEYIQTAIRWYERAVGINRYDNDALIKTARLYDSLGQRDEAEKYYTFALQADDRNSAYYTQFGLHYQRWKDSENAIANFQQAQQLGAPDPLPDIQLQRFGKSSGL